MTNIPEACIIKYILIYNNYIKYISYINIPKEYKELTILYHTLQILQEKYPSTDKTLDELETFVYACYPQMRQGERETIHVLIEQIRATEVRDELLQDLLVSIKKRSVSRQAALAFYEASEGRGSWDKALEIVSNVDDGEASGETLKWKECLVTDDLNELQKFTVSEGGLRWPLSCLNESLGPLRAGDFGFVFARPETGKTTFLAHMVSHMAEQTSQNIVWFNNEEQGGKVRIRTIQSALGVTAHELWGDIASHKQKYEGFTGGRIKLLDEERGTTFTRALVESVLQEFKPILVVFDQIDKVQGFDADRNDLVYGAIYKWARRLGKDHKCAVVGTCQSDGTGEGVKWLTMSHVADAKTSKQAEADWILGIGKSNEGGTEAVRYFNISKNKLIGDEFTDPELRHGRFEVWIHPTIARYEDMG